MKTVRGFKFDSSPMLLAFTRWGHGYQALATHLGRSYSAVYKVINGECPTSKLMPEIAEIIGCNLDECWKSSGKNGEKSNKGEKVKTGDTQCHV